MHLIENPNDPASLTFNWEMLALGGDPAIGGAGFSNPDNLLIDRAQNVWLVCDMASNRMNQPIKAIDKDSDRRGLFGNNNLWCIPTTGESAGKAYLFAMGPMESELTGPFLSLDERSLFLSVQHPGETHGTRQNLKAETRRFELTDDRGTPFTQTRTVPIGSNFPDLKPNSATKPAIVVITRQDNQPIHGTTSGTSV